MCVLREVGQRCEMTRWRAVLFGVPGRPSTVRAFTSNPLLNGYPFLNRTVRDMGRAWGRVTDRAVPFGGTGGLYDGDGPTAQNFRRQATATVRSSDYCRRRRHRQQGEEEKGTI